MRSVFLFLEESDKSKIVNVLNSLCLNNKDIQWLFGSIENPILYIEFDENKELINDLEAEDNSIFVILDRLDDYTILIIDISGRHSGENEVMIVLNALLTQFNGFVMDDYTEHLWTLKKIVNQERFKNHKFFDYNGWYEEGKT